MACVRAACVGIAVCVSFLPDKMPDEQFLQTLKDMPFMERLALLCSEAERLLSFSAYSDFLAALPICDLGLQGFCFCLGMSTDINFTPIPSKDNTHVFQRTRIQHTSAPSHLPILCLMTPSF